jgi:hypothetical protein
MSNVLNSLDILDTLDISDILYILDLLNLLNILYIMYLHELQIVNDLSSHTDLWSVKHRDKKGKQVHRHHIQN